MLRLLPTVLVLLALLGAVRLAAAPLPSLPPVDVTGTIAAAAWHPARQVAGVAGLSGTAGQDRTFAAHFLVRLTDYRGVDAAIARELTQRLDWHALDGSPDPASPPFLLLRIEHPDRGFLRPGMRIRVTGYSIGGDEGGTWTSVQRLDIVTP